MDHGRSLPERKALPSVRFIRWDETTLLPKVFPSLHSDGMSRCMGYSILPRSPLRINWSSRMTLCCEIFS